MADAAASEIEDLIGYNLKRAYVIFRSDFSDTLGKDGLAPRSFSVLALAVANPEITQSEVARKLGIERSGLVAIVDQLEALGYLNRVSVPGDRRVQALAPTEEGRRMYEVAAREVARHEARILSVLSESERTSLARILGKLRKSWEAE